MDKIIEVLFNTNHEMPSGWVLVALMILAIVVPNLMRWIQNSRDGVYQKNVSDKLLAAEKPRKPKAKKKKKK